jgi:hypothetical protein
VDKQQYQSRTFIHPKTPSVGNRQIDDQSRTVSRGGATYTMNTAQIGGNGSA